MGKNPVHIQEVVNCITYDDFVQLDQKRYFYCCTKWTTAYKSHLEESNFSAIGNIAIKRSKENLPSDCYVFRIPGCKYLPHSTSFEDLSYTYLCKSIKDFDETKLMAFDSIICDINFKWTIIIMHEDNHYGGPHYIDIRNNEIA